MNLIFGSGNNISFVFDKMNDDIRVKETFTKLSLWCESNKLLSIEYSSDIDVLSVYKYHFPDFC